MFQIETLSYKFRFFNNHLTKYFTKLACKLNLKKYTSDTLIIINFVFFERLFII